MWLLDEFVRCHYSRSACVLIPSFVRCTGVYVGVLGVGGAVLRGFAALFSDQVFDCVVCLCFIVCVDLVVDWMCACSLYLCCSSLCLGLVYVVVGYVVY